MKKSILYLLFSTSCFLLPVSAQPVYQWSGTMQKNVCEPHDMKVDASGNVYTTGAFKNTVDFDPSSAVYNLVAGFEFDVFVMKQNASGNLLWAKRVGGELAYNDDQGKGLAVDASGNVYTTGTFQGTADFDPSPTAYYPLTAAGTDVFVQKLDADGNFVWAVQLSSVGINFNVAIALDASGQPHIAGSFKGTVDFDPSSTATANLSTNFSNDTDGFVWKLTTDGNFAWAKQFKGNDFTSSANELAFDASGNLYVAGTFNNEVDLDPGAGTATYTSSSGDDVFIVKLNSNGEYVWSKVIGENSSASVCAINIDPAGDVITTGLFYNTMDFDPGAGTFTMTSVGNSDMFIQKLDASGNFVWAKRMGQQYEDFVFGSVLDAAGSVYTTGSFDRPVDFDPGSGVHTLTENSVANGNTFVQKLDNTGNFVWAKSMSGVGGNQARAIAVDAAGGIYTAGTFFGNVGFNPTVYVNDPNDPLTTGGMFICKWKETLVTSAVDAQKEMQLQSYPNPTTGLHTIKTEQQHTTLTAEVYDSQGRLQSTHRVNDSDQLTFSVEGPQGIYAVVINADDSRKTIRLIKL